MTVDQIIKACYSFAVVVLCGLNYHLWPGSLIGISIILAANIIGGFFGKD